MTSSPMELNSQIEAIEVDTDINKGMPKFIQDQQGSISPYEFLPAWVFYTPVVLQSLALALRYGDVRLPLVANPSIKLSGMVGESKHDILSLAGDYAKQWISPFISMTQSGDNIVSTPQLYGGTYTLFAHMLPQQGIDVRFAKDDKPESLAELIDENTKAVYCESIGNPAGNIVDTEGITTLAHQKGVPVIVDNTVSTPILCKPIQYGADIVVHSLTKYVGGHGTTLGGVIVDSGKFPWTQHKDRFPVFNQPEPSCHGVVYTEAFGEAAFIGRARTVPLRNTGSAFSPMNAFMLMHGLETLSLRMERHCENAKRVAQYLEGHDKVSWVSYAGLSNSEHYDLAQKYMDGKPSVILSFGLKDGYEAGVRFYDALELFKRLVNIGDAKSLACHPTSTTHRQMSVVEQAAAGVVPEMILLSVGIEHIDDIIADLDQALKA
jgi:O-acetylhomoserine (thiol)-lyase